MRVLDERFVEETTTDPGLVRHDDDLEPGTIEEANGIDRERKERDAIKAIEVANFFDERSIAVEKYGAVHVTTSSRRPAGLAGASDNRAVTVATTESTVMPFMHR